MSKIFRQRIGVESSEYVTRQHLLNYGRLDVGFTKIDNETYLIDFRPNLESGIEKRNSLWNKDIPTILNP